MSLALAETTRDRQPDTGGTTALADAAALYAEHGIAIFPCQPRGKRPMHDRCPDAFDAAGRKLGGDQLAEHAAECPRDGHGFHDATADPDQVTEWWRQHPDANIGIPMGANGIFALDVDGPEGRAALDRLETDYHPLPETYQVVTGREAGRHHIFAQPTDGPAVRNRQLAGHLETRGDGGYIVAPPSIHPNGRPYLALGSWGQIAEAPGWLVALTERTATVAPAPAAGTGGVDVSRRLRGLAGTVAIADEGNRNDTLNWAAYTAGQIVGAGAADRPTVEALLQAAAARAGLEPSETAATIRSGIDAGTANPEPSPPPGGPVPAPGNNGHTGTTPDDLAELVRGRARTGAEFLAATRGPIPAIWGDSNEVLWAQGEGLLVAGPAGVGKSTIVQQVVAGLCGHPDRTNPLGRPIHGPRNVLYLALDRPRQIGRSMARILDPDHDATGRLTVWDQPLPFDPAIDRTGLTRMAAAVGCDVIIIDSLYDLSPSIVKPEVAGEVIRTLKIAVNEGVDIVAIHHPRKQPPGPRTRRVHLDDLYGGMQLGAGFGSVLYLRGDAGDPNVTLLHLKQPGDVVGPLNILHDHETGTSAVTNDVDLVAVAITAGTVTARDAACLIEDTDQPDKPAVERARRRLEQLVKQGQLDVGRTTVGGPTVYIPGGVTVLEDMEVPL